MAKKRNTCQEVLTWRKMSSTLLSRPTCHLLPTLMRLHGVPLFPGQERSRPHSPRGTTYCLPWPTSHSSKYKVPFWQDQYLSISCNVRSTV